MDSFMQRRNVLGLGAAGAVLAGGALLDPTKAAAQAASGSVLRTALDRGKLIVGTGSTNPPWHFEDDKGNLTGMDIAMARILAKGLFDDDTKVEYVRQDPAARVRQSLAPLFAGLRHVRSRDPPVLAIRVQSAQSQSA